jgi:hypothetical protein
MEEYLLFADVFALISFTTMVLVDFEMLPKPKEHP